MVNSMKKRYEELKKYRNMILNYDDILLFYPDYYKTKIDLKNKKIISKDEINKEFEKNYKLSSLYQELIKIKPEEEVYQIMNYNKNLKYKCFKLLFNSLKKDGIKMCELIDYIGHYPNTYPVPKEEEKNKEMEKLLEKYDIMVRYYLDDELDYMQISSDDIVRIIEKLKKDLNCIQIIEEEVTTNEWMYTKKMSVIDRVTSTEELLKEIEEFPLSYYQEQGRSKREEDKKYLRLQHGKNII